MSCVIRRRIGVLLGFSLLLVFADLSRAEDSFTKGKTVLVLVGLPGDAESEETYTDQVNRLLDCFSQPDSIPKNVILLSSLTGVSKDAKKFPLTLGDNKRDSFLQTASGLKPDELGNLVFIMMGHGGVLSENRVFHVPGPRLSPRDVAVLTNKLGTGSACLMFFPGSGLFCSGSQPPGVTFLTSDGDEPFKHDPRAAELFIETLEKQRGPLPAFAIAFGKQVRSWYETRGEVRDEEPTLWVDGKPQNLWTASAATTPSPEPQVTIKLAAQVPPGPVTVQTAPVESSAWDQIHPVDAKDYPNVDAVMLLDRTAMLLDDSSTTRTDAEQFIQILTLNGKRFGDFQFSYDTPNDDLQIQACEVRLPDGSIKPIESSDIHDSGPNSEEEEVTHTHHKVFSLPHAEPGSILHVKTVRTEKRLEWPHITDSLDLGTEIPVVERKLDIKLPASSAFHYRIFAVPNQDPVVSHGTYGNQYSWEWKSVSPTPGEPFMPPNCSPEMGISTFPDWGDFTDWYRRIIRGSDALTPEMAALAQDLTKNCKTDQDKVEAITRFVTQFRYISVPLGVNGIRPHFAADVCTKRYGDCKDKANLVDTLLRSLGFKTDLVLVPRGGQAYADLPGCNLNHAIAWVQVGGKSEWIDSTDDVCRTGFLPPGDCGRSVLLVNSLPAKCLTTLPLPDAEASQLDLNITMSWPDETKRDPAIQIDLNASGIGDYLFRAVGTHNPDAQQKKPWMNALLEPSTGKLILQEQTASDLSDLTADVHTSAHGQWIGALTRLSGSTQLIRLPFLLPHNWVSALLPRTKPMELTYGYPMKLAEKIHMKLPGKGGQVVLPAAVEDSNSVDSWKISWTQSSPTELLAYVQFTLAKPEMLAPNEPGDYQKSMSQFIDALQDGVQVTTAQ